MKKLLYLLLLFFCPYFSKAQITDQYKGMIKKAEAYYNNKQYKESADMYQAAFHSGSKMVMISDHYNASLSMAHAGMYDSAFYQLNEVATIGEFADCDYLKKDTDLFSLHNDPRWDSICSKVLENKVKKDKKEANYNKPLVAMLDTIRTDDQTERRKMESTRKEFGQASKEMQALGKVVKEKDSINLMKVEKILEQYGWLGPDVIGPEGNRTLFLVIQHADIKTQEKYLPMIREAVKNHKASASNLALLEDRIALRKGNMQIYGSQIGYEKDGGSYVLPLEDPDNVDKRRATVGLGPLADYVQRWNLKWDPVEYKKQLPEIIKKQKEASGN